MNDTKGSLFQALVDAKKRYAETDANQQTQQKITSSDVTPSESLPLPVNEPQTTPVKNTLSQKSHVVKKRKNSKKAVFSTQEAPLPSQSMSTDTTLFLNALAQNPTPKEKKKKDGFFLSPFAQIKSEDPRHIKEMKKKSENFKNDRNTHASKKQEGGTFSSLSSSTLPQPRSLAGGKKANAATSKKMNAQSAQATESQLTEKEEKALWATTMHKEMTNKQRAKLFNQALELEQEADMERESAEKSGAEAQLFAKAMAGVDPISAKGREVAIGSVPITTTPVAGLDLATLLAENFEFALAHTDEYLEGFVVGTDPLVINKLKGGQYSPEAHLDLHGQNASQALDALLWFMKNAYQRHLRCVLIITGRGKNSPDKVGILRGHLQNWLTREPFKRVVIAFCTAKQSDGGTGAVYVLLRKLKKSRGKVIWERLPYSDDYYDI